MMRMVDAEFEYTYEYQGNAPKLVHTPLTDKCYLTLTQGTRLELFLFSNLSSLFCPLRRANIPTFLCTPVPS